MSLFRRLPCRRFVSTTQAVDPCIKCPSCSTCFKFGKKSFFCPQCNELKAPGHVHALNFFALLGIPKSYKLDLKDAEQKYRNLQKIVHPDHLGSDSNTDYCALLNDAIKVIKDPVERASHLLELEGVKPPTEESRVGDKELLMEIMEWNDAIDDAVGNRETLEKLLLELQSSKLSFEEKMGSAYEKEDFDELGKLLEKTRFLQRIEQRINGLLML